MEVTVGDRQEARVFVLDSLAFQATPNNDGQGKTTIPRTK
jgi:hypothetical protein